MNRKPSVCMNDLLNQKPPRKSKQDQIPMTPQIISEQSISEKKKKQNILKLLTSDYSNSINKIEFAHQIDDRKNQTKKYHILRDAIKLIHEEFLQSLSMKRNIQKIIVPQFIRLRDQQKREMQKIISNNNSSQYNTSKKKERNYQVIFIEIILLISIIYMWSQMIGYSNNK